MIRAANHSSYPLADHNPPDRQLREMRAARERGTAAGAELAAVQDEVATIVVAEQSRAFIDIVTDGMVGWDGLLAHIAEQLDGLEPGERTTWLETALPDRRPVCRGAIARPRAFLERDYRVAREVAQKPVKIVLPGPVTFARLTDDRHYGDPGALARGLAGALAEEVSELAAAGATHFQLDEPLLCRHPDDLELVAETAGRVFAAAGEGATTVLSTYFGDLAALAGRLDQLPGTHLGLDMVDAGPNAELLARLPDGKGVYLGLFDARDGEAEDAADVARRLAPHRETLAARDVIVGPQAGLGALGRDEAFDKLLQARYLVETLTGEWGAR